MDNFYELKAKLHFLTLAGSIRTMADLWPLYELLMHRQGEIMTSLNHLYGALWEEHEEEKRESIDANLRELLRLYWEDIALIQKWCQQRGIERPGKEWEEEIPF